MTAREAAEYLGCTIQHVRLLIRRGQLSARRRRVVGPNGGISYEYQLSEKKVKRFQLIPQTFGRPRGAKNRHLRLRKIIPKLPDMGLTILGREPKVIIEEWNDDED